MFNIFKRKVVTFLDNEWAVIKRNIKVSSVPRAHELVYLTDEGNYYRVCNVVHNITDNNRGEIFVVIEKYTDDFKLSEKKIENNLTSK